MEEIKVLEIDKEIMEIVKIVLGQNHLILMTNKLLLEKLAAPPIIVTQKER